MIVSFSFLSQPDVFLKYSIAAPQEFWGNNQFRVAEKRARDEHEDFQTFRKVFESRALHDLG